jgi:predicted RNA-binding Zn ribbon-like protein
VNFNSHYDAPVRLAATIANALTQGETGGRPYPLPVGEARREAAAGALRSIAPDVGRITLAEANAFAALAATLRGVFTAVAAGDPDTAVRAVNQTLRNAKAQPYLTRHDGQPWHLHHRGTAGGVAAEWAGVCAAGLAVVLGSDARNRLGLCTAPRCDRVYVDTSHNGSRRFCSTTCQNRVKTAAYRARTS